VTKSRHQKALEEERDPLVRALRHGLPGYPQLSARMHELGWTNLVLGRQVGVTGSLISHIRLGHRPVTAGLRRDIPIVIARALGIDADELRIEIFGPDEPPQPQRVSVFAYPDDTDPEDTDQGGAHA
jgi:hypothetical protein